MDAEREDRVLAHVGRAIKIIALPHIFSRKLKLWSFYVAVTQGMTMKFTKKLEARVELLFYFLFLLVYSFICFSIFFICC